METTILHSWDITPRQAIEIQRHLRDRLILTWANRKIATVGGVDVSLKDKKARAAIVVLHYPDLTPVDDATIEADVHFPYVPGLLAFREGPVVLRAWEKLEKKPDLLMFDGQGIAHPRGIGIASHMGLWLNRPTIGVAKSRLFGHHAAPGLIRGDYADLIDDYHQTQIIGAALRTRTSVNPVYVSPGHLIDVSQSIRFVLKCCTSYRLPETTRWAHLVAGGHNIPKKAGFQSKIF
jgi:deoxyribonuclease V